MKNFLLIILMVFLSVGAIYRNVGWGKTKYSRAFAEKWLESFFWLTIILLIGTALD